MGEKVLFLIVLVSLTNSLAMANVWNIFNFGKKNSLDAINLKSYCESWRVNVELNNIRGFSVVPEECTDYIGDYMTSTQYVLDSQTTVEECQLYLSGYLNGENKDAWIFDIDDTLLSTVPYFKRHRFGGDGLNSTSLELWMGESKAPALEQSQKLFNEIRRRGFKIYLISARSEYLRDATVDNLIDVGYHGWNGLVLRDLEDKFKSVKDYKAAARKKLVDEGYIIWGILGDQWSSFEGCPYGKRTFKLPNSMYYVS